MLWRTVIHLPYIRKQSDTRMQDARWSKLTGNGEEPGLSDGTYIYARLEAEGRNSRDTTQDKSLTIHLIKYSFFQSPLPWFPSANSVKQWGIKRGKQVLRGAFADAHGYFNGVAMNSISVSLVQVDALCPCVILSALWMASTNSKGKILFFS